MRLRNHRQVKRRPYSLGVALLAALVLAAGAAAPAPRRARRPLPLACRRGRSYYPVNYSFASGFVSGFLFPNVAPAGAHDWSCKPSTAHPYPVVLVHGTFENMNDNWGGASPLLADNGYCVFAFNYGGTSASSDIQGTGGIAASAADPARDLREPGCWPPPVPRRSTWSGTPKAG